MKFESYSDSEFQQTCDTYGKDKVMIYAPCNSLGHWTQGTPGRGAFIQAFAGPSCNTIRTAYAKGDTAGMASDVTCASPRTLRTPRTPSEDLDGGRWLYFDRVSFPEQRRNGPASPSGCSSRQHTVCAIFMLTFANHDVVGFRPPPPSLSAVATTPAAIMLNGTFTAGLGTEVLTLDRQGRRSPKQIQPSSTR